MTICSKHSEATFEALPPTAQEPQVGDHWTRFYHSFVCMHFHSWTPDLQVLGRGTMVILRVFPARRSSWASSRWGSVTTERPSTASSRSPGRICPLLEAGLPRRTVTNRWGRRDAAEEKEKKNIFTYQKCHWFSDFDFPAKTPAPSPKLSFLNQGVFVLFFVSVPQFLETRSNSVQDWLDLVSLNKWLPPFSPWNTRSFVLSPFPSINPRLHPLTAGS